MICNVSSRTTKLYTPEAVAKLDKLAIESGISGYTLMRRAGQAVFDLLLEQYPDAKNILVLCGAGNNAGDGYVVARLAQQQGMAVDVVSLVDPEQLRGDAEQAYTQWDEIGSVLPADRSLVDQADVIVDALLGTGLDRDVENEWKRWIETVNASGREVIAIDVPSGLDARTGAIRGAAINADWTVSFIGLKAGLFTASGKACSGTIVFNSLDVPEEIYGEVDIFAELLDTPVLPARSDDSHKGTHGHVVIIGGNRGMPGAVILAARAALRSGAGLVSVVTRAEHVTAVAAACPEATVHASVNGELPLSLRTDISCVAIGPGLGKNSWAHRLLIESLDIERPMVVDADALNMIARSNIEINVPHIITPHPGEAARLLSMSTAEVQSDRFAATELLYKKTGGTVVLKGSGTIVFGGNRFDVCPYGNAAMAVAGMGDVLTGVIASLVAQGMEPGQAATSGVCLHAMAGDIAAEGRDRGMLASDVIEWLPVVASNL